MDISSSIPHSGFPALIQSAGWNLPEWLKAFGDTVRRRVLEWFQIGEWPWFGSHGMATLTGARLALGMRPEDDPEHDPEEDDDMEDEAAFGEFRHESVMMAEVIAALEPGPGKLMFDGTLGGGGHAGALLEAGVKLVAMDQDPHAIRHSTKHLSAYGDRLCILRGNFRDFPQILAETGVTGFDGMLVDLGVSSHQLDEAARGFSFQKNGPLDLRMDPESGRPAADLVNDESEAEIERILREFGEEPQARRIARAIVEARAKKRIGTTAELAGIITAAIGKKGKKHPATLTFQALRIAVNDELAALLQFLEAAPKWLKPGGRLVVISFHSLEDRIVKQAFHHLSTPLVDRPEWPAPRPNPDFCMRLPRRKPLEPTEEETARNPRARSAKLRVAEKMPHEP